MQTRKVFLVISAVAVMLAVHPVVAHAAEIRAMHRLYNPNSGEHFYTGRAGERDALVKVGWKSEGTGWYAPTKSETPVYRLYNPNAGDHHYTTNKGERDALVKVGWKSEGIGWYSDDDKSIPLYRQYNPNAKTGTHNYTTSKGENDQLVKLGWKAEGIGWYGVESPGSIKDDGKTYHELVTRNVYRTVQDYEKKTVVVTSDGQQFNTVDEAIAYIAAAGRGSGLTYSVQTVQVPAGTHQEFDHVEVVQEEGWY